MKEPDHLHQITTYVSEQINNLEDGGILFLPGGWNDGIGKNVHLVYVITRTDDSTYSFVVCNVGPGNEYHLSTVTKESELRFEFTSRSCWFALFTWLCAPLQVLSDKDVKQNQGGANCKPSLHFVPTLLTDRARVSQGRTSLRSHTPVAVGKTIIRNQIGPQNKEVHRSWPDRGKVDNRSLEMPTTLSHRFP